MRRTSIGGMTTMPERYDVIIIGTGAGGGTLAHTLAPSGKKILLIERGDFLPRERENWEPDPVFVEGRYISPDTWYDADHKPFQPQVHYYVGGATKMYGAALYRLRPTGLRGTEARRRHLPRVAVVLRRLRAVVFAGPSSCTRCTATTARIRPRDTGASNTRGRRSRTNPGSSSSRTTSRPPDISPTTRPAASCSTRRTGPRAPASAARGATATRASCTRSRTPNRSPYGPSCHRRT